MYKPKAVYGSDVGKGAYEIPRYDARKEVKSGEDKMSKSGLLMKLEWPEEKIFDDGKQSNTLTGAAHPGCCKQ